MLNLDAGVASPLRVQLADGATDLYPLFTVYDRGGTEIDEFGATHLANGLYTASWTPPAEGLYSVVTSIWTDSGHTAQAEYDVVSEDVRVDSTQAVLERLLGLNQENASHDSQVYDSAGNLTSARIRTYETAADALAGGLTGMVAQYTLAASYDVDGRLTSYKVMRSA